VLRQSANAEKNVMADATLLAEKLMRAMPLTLQGDTKHNTESEA
jgi:hypothetical protein